MSKMTVFGTVVAGALTVSSAAWAIDVEKSIAIAKTPTEVWAVMGEFCAIADWHPVIASCELQDKDGTAHRMLTTGDGGEIFEKQLSYDADDMIYEYAILESPLPVADYVSSIKVVADGGGSKVVWSSSFNSAGISDDEAAGLIGGIYDAGLNEIANQLAN